MVYPHGFQSLSFNLRGLLEGVEHGSLSADNMEEMAEDWNLTSTPALPNQAGWTTMFEKRMAPATHSGKCWHVVFLCIFLKLGKPVSCIEIMSNYLSSRWNVDHKLAPFSGAWNPQDHSDRNCWSFAAETWDCPWRGMATQKTHERIDLQMLQYSCTLWAQYNLVLYFMTLWYMMHETWIIIHDTFSIYTCTHIYVYTFWYLHRPVCIVHN